MCSPQTEFSIRSESLGFFNSVCFNIIGIFNYSEALPTHYFYLGLPRDAAWEIEFEEIVHTMAREPRGVLGESLAIDVPDK